MTERTERAYRALLQAQYTEGGADTIEDAVCDLFADLIHLSKEYNFDAAEVFARAQVHAQVEACPIELTDKRVYWPFNDSTPQDATYDAIFTTKGTTLLAKEADGCEGCAFLRGPVDNVFCGDAPFCGGTTRDDKRTVIWVKGE